MIRKPHLLLMFAVFFLVVMLGTSTLTPPTLRPVFAVTTTPSGPNLTILPSTSPTPGLTHSPATFIVGQNGQITIIVSNVGDVDAAATISVTDTLPAGFGYIATGAGSNGAGWTCPGGNLPPSSVPQTVTCTLAGSILSNNSSTLTLTVTTNALAVPSKTNQAVVNQTPNAEPNIFDNTATENIPVQGIPDMAITMTTDPVYTVGTPGSIVLGITNHGTGPAATGTSTVVENLPTGFSVTSVNGGSSWNCTTPSAQQISCTNTGDIVAFSPTSNISVSVTAATVTSGSTTATVSATAESSATLSDNSVSKTLTSTGAPDLTISKAGPATAVAGTNITYTLTVNNIGTGPTSSNVIVTDTLPTNFNLAGYSNPDGFICTGTNAVTCTKSTTFAAGATSNIALTVHITDGTTGTVTNSAHVSTPSGESQTGNNDSNVVTTTVSAVDLSITKTGPVSGKFSAGATGQTFSLAVTNVAGPTATATTGTITVTDTLATGLTYNVGATIPGVFTCGAVGQVVTCTTPGPLAPGNTDTITLGVDVAANAPASITNQATVSTPGDDPSAGSATAANDTSAVVTVTITRPDIAVTKTNLNPFSSGINGDFLINVSNAGNDAAAIGSITLSDPLPTGFNLVSWSSTGGFWNCAPAGPQASPVTMTCSNLLALAAGASAPQLTITVNPNVVAGTPYTNTATATTTRDIVTTNDAGTVSGVVGAAPGPDLNITQSHTDPCTVGAVCSYTVTVTNGGLGPTTGIITVIDTLPTSFTAASGAGGAGWNACTVSNNVVTCTANGPLASGVALSTLTINGTPSTTLGSPFTNSVTVNTTGDTNLADNTSAAPAGTTNVVAANAPDLQITKSHSGNFLTNPTPGAPYTNTGVYNITVTNVGQTVTPGGTITVHETLPPGFNYVTFAGTGWTCPAGPVDAPSSTTSVATFACTHADPGLTTSTALPVLQITVSPQAAGTACNPPTVTTGCFMNTVTVDTVTGETNNANNTANDPTTVTASAAPDLSIAKNHCAVTGPGCTPLTFTAGTQGTYHINVTNLGTQDYTSGTTVTDTLPTGMTYQTSSGLGWVCSASGQTVTCTNPQTVTMNGGVLGELSVVVNVATSAGGTLTNTASVNVPTGDPNTTNNSASDVTNVTGTADLAITKFAAGNFQVGVNGTWTLRVTNAGGTTVTGTTTVTDALPVGMSMLTGGGGGFACTGTTTVTCTRTTNIPVGTTNYDITINVSVASGSGQVTNQATLTNANDTNGANNLATATGTVTTGAQPDTTITKTHSGTGFTIGTNGTYTLTASNMGTAAATGTITVTDVLPPQLSFVSGGGGGFTCTASGQTVTCSNPAGLAANTNAPITLTVGVAGPVNPALTNTATISVAPNDANTGNQSGSDTVAINNAPPASAANSTIGVFPSSIPADGTTQATITVTVRDASNNPVANDLITLSSDTPLPSGVNVSGFTGTTNASGIVTFTVSGNPPGTPVSVSFRATDSNAIIITNPPPGGTRTLTFTTPVNPNALSTTLSSAFASPTSVANDGVAFSTITVTIMSNGGSPVSGASVTLTGTPNTNVFVAPSSTQFTNGSGQAFFQVRSTTAQTVTFTIQAMNGTGSITLTQQPQVTFVSNITPTATVTALPGVVSGTRSTLTTDFISIPADNITTATLTVHLFDGNGSPIAGKTVSIVGNPVLAGVTVQSTSPVTNSGGIATFTVRSATQGGPVTFTATDTTDNIVVTQTVSISFTAPGTAPVAAPTTTGTPGTGTPGTPGVVIGEALLNPPSSGPSLGIVVPYRLRVRTGPGTRFPRIGLLKQRTIVVLLARNSRGTWFLIQLENGKAGWVSAFWVRVKRVAFRHLPIVPDDVDLSQFAGVGGNNNVTTPPLVTPTFQPGQGGGVITGYLVRYRSGPGTNFAQLGTLKSGTEIVLIGKSSDGLWFEFNIPGGGTAWISAQFVRVTNLNGDSLPVVTP